MTTPDLPEPIAAYFRADARSGLAVARCFTPHGAVLDEGRTHAGQAAIEAWKTEASRRYTYTTRPRSLERDADRYVVTGQVSGDFPGSPVELRFVFMLDGDKIASLEIRP
jgi:hypothetical protein